MFIQSPSFSIKGEKFNVIILASGLGSKLGQETAQIPKALVELDDKGTKAIDYLIQKFQHVAGRLIITTAYCADLLEFYIKGKYSMFNPVFSREKVSELKGPGTSLVLGLDQASSRLPTIVLFCDYIVEDYIPVDNDALCISKKPEDPYIVDSHPKGTPVIEGEIITDLVPNQSLEEEKYGGFTGISIFHDTLLFKSIAYTKAYEKKLNAAYDFDMVKDYVRRIKTVPIYVSKMYELGTAEMLKRVREIHNYSK
jgi:choline kinase